MIWTKTIGWLFNRPPVKMNKFVGKLVLNRVFVEVDKDVKSKKADLIIKGQGSKDNKLDTRIGTVAQVGPGGMDNGILVPMTVKVGDRVIYNYREAQELELKGVTYHAIVEQSVFVINPDES